MVALKTFNNLKKERQQEIIAVCLEEFALNDYQSASLSEIIKKLDLGKGSFYRYFESKQSLYFFLLDHCVQQRIESDAAMITSPPEDFFDLILQHFRAKIHFDKVHSLASAFLYSALNEKNSEELGNLHIVRKQKALEILQKLVDEHIAKGQLRTDLDREVIAWNVIQTQLSILDYVELRFQQNFRENIRLHKRLHDIPDQELMQVARQFVEIQKNGLRPQP